VIFKAGSRTGPQRSLLTIDDLTWLGQAKFPSTGTNGTDAGSSTGGYGRALAVRYAYNKESTPAIERLYLICFYSTTSTTTVGDLVEYRAPTLSTGTISGASEMIEVRRWKALDWFPKGASDTQWGGTSACIGGLYWQPDLTDANGGVLWASTWGEYHSAGDFKNIYAVKLSHTMVDATYSTVVQRYGPWEYSGTDGGDFKEASFGALSIPASAQADLGGKTVALQGHYSSQSSPEFLPYGPSLRGLSAMPTLATSTPWNSGDIITRGNKIFSSTQNDGNAKLPRNTLVDAEVVERFEIRTNNGGVWTNFESPWTPLALGSNVGDYLYIEVHVFTPTYLENFWVVMNTPCVGGTKVWKYYNGSTWETLSGSFSHGNANLTASENNFVLSSVPSDWAVFSANGYSTRWCRIENTVAPSTAGTLQTGGAHVGPDSPEQDNSGDSWYPQVDSHMGLAWVETTTKHGLVTFARQSDGYVWYGERRGFYQSTPIAVEDDFSNWTVTGHGYRSQHMYPRLYIYDPMQIRAAAGNGTRDNVGPPSEADWVAQWPNIPYFNTIAGGDYRYIDIWQANVTYWDAVAQELIWSPWATTNIVAGVPGGAPSLQVFSVAG
jgi:hypothetical protein